MKNNDAASSSATKGATKGGGAKVKPKSASSTKRGCSKSSRTALKDLIAERRKTTAPGIQFEVSLMDPYEAVTNYKTYKENKTGYIEQQSEGHYCLWDSSYPENPQRASAIKRRFQILGLINRCEQIQSQTFPDELILKKHSNEIFERLKNTSEFSEHQLKEESSKWDSVYLSQETYASSKLAVNAALTLTLEVAKGNLKNGFALIRPPGHHAMENALCGYCFINNVAIAAETAIAKGLAKKVLIVDYDVHHGQATQQMFYDRNNVLYFSIHRFEHGEFWPNLRESDSDYIGKGKGKGYNVNVPLNEPGLGDSDYLAIVLNLLLPLAYEFNPDLILISAGYDAAIGCPEGDMKVSPHFYSHIISLLSGLANGKIVVCLEGGYFRQSLAEGAAWTLKSLLGDVSFPVEIKSVQESVIEVINNVKYFLRNYWDCFKTETLFDYPKKDSGLECLQFDKEDEHVTVIDFKSTIEEVTSYEIADCYPVQTTEQVNEFIAIIEQLRKDYLTGRVCNAGVGYVYDDEFLKHKPSNETAKVPPETPERLIEIMREFLDFGLKSRCTEIEQIKYNEKQWLLKIHKTDYIRNILIQENISEKPDWFFNEHTTNCVLKCVSNILTLADSISKGDIRSGVALIRPPGHHASGDHGSGFCFVNNVVIASEYLIQQRHYKRLLIVDFDIHHGNGTQELTYNRSDIMYISIHRFDKGKFFPSTPEGDFHYTGENEGKGYNINIPFNKGKKNNVDYWTVWYKLVLPMAYSYAPDFIIISAGFDAGIYDPLGGYEIYPEMFGHFVQTLKALASGKILLALEGGYHVKTTALSMMMCIKALLGDALPGPNFTAKCSDDTLETVSNVIKTHKEKWPILQVNKKLANFSCNNTQKQKLEELLNDKSEKSKKEFEKIVGECRGQSS